MHAAIVFLCLVVSIRKGNSCLHPAERDGVPLPAGDLEITLTDLVAGVRWHGPLSSFKEKGWFTIAGSSDPVEVREPRTGDRS